MIGTWTSMCEKCESHADSESIAKAVNQALSDNETDETAMNLEGFQTG